MRTGAGRIFAFLIIAADAMAPTGSAAAQSVRVEPGAPSTAPVLRATEQVDDVAETSPVQANPPARPTDVRVGLTVLGINRVSPPNEAFPTFDATVMLTIKWDDPRLAFDPADGDDRHVYTGAEAGERLTNMWAPDLNIENEEGERAVDTRTLIVHDDGSVTLEETFDGRFRVPFDLRAFPFDTQRFSFEIGSGAWNAQQVTLRPIRDRIIVDDEVRVRDWSLGSVHAEVREVQEARSRRPFSKLFIELEARREPGFYLNKILLPVLLIIACTWTTFWMTGEPAGTRLQRGFIALLSLVAFTQVISQHLPRISYITFLDGVMYLAFASTGLLLIEVVATHRAEARGAKEFAVRLDRISRVAFPVAFLTGVAALYSIFA